jgi:hypothetical protein
VIKMLKLSVAFILLLLFAVGCSSGQNTNLDSNVIAVVNGQEITEEDIKREQETRLITIEVITRSQVIVNLKQPVLSVEDFLGSEKIDTYSYSAVKRFVDRRNKASALIPLDEQAAFNNTIRDVVLQQEATRQGFEVSVEEVKALFEELIYFTQTEYETNDASEVHRQLRSIEDEVAKAFNYESMQVYREKRMDLLARSMTINKMRRSFNMETAKDYDKNEGELREVPDHIYIENEWEDYTEYLLRKARVNIAKDGYSIEYVGSTWNRGNINLSPNE